ncbi:MAG: choline-sulfatase [Chloroflexi bacterium]|nr:choline-sulfatase [Chloroflexota bacterium]
MSPSRDRPNILLIMADQLVPMLMGAYDHPVVQTPNLNRLVENGVRFDAAYTACPLCAPARAALATGRYISAIGAWDNASTFDDTEPTLQHYLARAGYETIASGKLHYIGADQLHGYRRRLTTDIYPAGLNMLPTNKRKPAERFIDRRSHARGYALPQVGVRTWTQFLAYDTETQFRAVEYLYGRACAGRPSRPDLGSEEPFFLSVSFHCPHDPFQVTQELWDLYEGQEIDIPQYPPDMEETYSIMDRWLNAYHGTDRIDIKAPESLYALRRSYYGLVTFIDRQVGELLRVLEETGLRENTIVFFTSDHGDMLAEKNMVQKRALYEWSARVPLIAHFPDGWGAGKTVRTPVNLIDLVPTVLDLAGVQERLPLDGLSLLPLIEGRENGRLTFSESHTNGVYAPCFMVREGDYKLIYIHEGQGERQLFNLAQDPGEWHNLANDPGHAALCDHLLQLILARFDPDDIEARLQASLDKRHLVDAANKANDVHWDYEPRFDAAKQYCR